MKIFKTSLKALTDEIRAPGPIYISNFCQTRGGEMPMLTYRVTIAGWNPEGRVCELLISSPPIWIYDMEERKIAGERSFESEREIKTRLVSMNYDLRDGRISDRPVLGMLD